MKFAGFCAAAQIWLSQRRRRSTASWGWRFDSWSAFRFHRFRADAPRLVRVPALLAATV